jgi:YVTN family beta-propeller protein
MLGFSSSERQVRPAAQFFIPAILALLAPFAAAAEPAAADCTAPPTAALTASLPAHPFAAIASADGCSIFVSLITPGRDNHGDVVLLRRDGDKLEAVRGVPLRGEPAILALTHDEKLLIAADAHDVAFLDPQILASGAGDAVLGYLDEGGEGVIGVAVSPDDGTLFVSDERSATLTVVDLAKARAGGFGADAVIGKIPVGRAPVGLALSPDGRLLYSTSEVAPPGAGWPVACPRESGGDTTPVNPRGALIVVDVARARADPSGAILARVPAGCNAVRVVLSPAGDRAYVTARGSNEVLVFDTAKLVSDPGAARLASVPTGNSPVGLAVTPDGARLIVTNSNRFARDRDASEALSVIDTAKVDGGAAAVLGTIAVGAFPRELRMAPGGVLLVTNFLSNTLQLIPLDTSPPPKN